MLQEYIAGKSVTWTDLLQSRVVIVLGEAGSGKSAELEAQSSAASSKSTFFVCLDALLSGLDATIAPTERASFEKWRTGNDEAVFFLDSVDEAMKPDWCDMEHLTKRLARHRHQEWLKSLTVIKSTVPSDKDVHLICDNYATHKHAKVKAWAKKNPRFHFHFTPTSASWLNMVERFFRDLSERALKRGSFYDANDLMGAITHHRVRQHAQRRPQAVQLDQERERHPRQGQASACRAA